jgi:hypothetical protein
MHAKKKSVFKLQTRSSIRVYDCSRSYLSFLVVVSFLLLSFLLFLRPQATSSRKKAGEKKKKPLQSVSQSVEWRLIKLVDIDAHVQNASPEFPLPFQQEKIVKKEQRPPPVLASHTCQRHRHHSTTLKTHSKHYF